MNTAVLLGSIVGSLLDPISLIGWIIAAATIRNYWAAIAAGIAWRLILQIVLVIPASQAYSTSSPNHLLPGALIAAVIATSVTFLIAKQVRTKKGSDSSAPPPSL